LSGASSRRRVNPEHFDWRPLPRSGRAPFDTRCAQFHLHRAGGYRSSADTHERRGCRSEDRPTLRRGRLLLLAIWRTHDEHLAEGIKCQTLSARKRLCRCTLTQTILDRHREGRGSADRHWRYADHTVIRAGLPLLVPGPQIRTQLEEDAMRNENIKSTIRRSAWLLRRSRFSNEPDARQHVNRCQRSSCSRSAMPRVRLNLLKAREQQADAEAMSSSSPGDLKPCPMGSPQTDGRDTTGTPISV
jgi:hypothetical protein